MILYKEMFLGVQAGAAQFGLCILLLPQPSCMTFIVTCLDSSTWNIVLIIILVPFVMGLDRVNL